MASVTGSVRGARGAGTAKTVSPAVSKSANVQMLGQMKMEMKAAQSAHE